MSGEGNASTAARIPVFASVPSWLNDAQERSKSFIYAHLERLYVEPRTVGGSDYAHFNPLQEVRTLAKHCAGGIVLGYQQFFATDVQWRDKRLPEFFAPTEWNHLETGVLFGLGLPLLVLREKGIDRGIFDVGSSAVFVHDMPMPPEPADPSATSPAARKKADELTKAAEQFRAEARKFEQVVLRWQSMVRARYYGDAADF